VGFILAFILPVRTDEADCRGVLSPSLSSFL